MYLPIPYDFPLHFPLPDKLVHFHRQHQRTPITPSVKPRDRLRDFLRQILVHEMPCLGKDLELIFALHLGDGQGFVEAVCAGEDEEFGDGGRRGEEFGAEV